MIFNTINETRFDKIMSAFSQLLGKYIREKDIQVFDLVNYCCIDRSTMYKMINGKRNPPSEDVFEKIAEFLCLSPQEYRQFKDAYQITVLGEEIYFRRKSVTEFLLNFPDCFSIASPSQVTTDDSRVQPQNIDLCQALTSQIKLNYVISKVLQSEAEKEHGTIALLLQPDFEFIFSYLASLSISSDLKISHIVCLNNTSFLTPKKKSYRLEYLKNIFPLYLRDIDYHVHYYYDSVHSHFFNMNMFPCLILTSDYAISFSSDCQNGILYHEASVIAQFWNLFKHYQEKCPRLFELFRITPQDLNVLNDIVITASPCYILQPESCFTPFITEKIARDALLPQIPDRARILAMVNAFFQNTSNVITEQDMHIYFTEDGIRHFMKTGILREIPQDFSRPFTPTERLEMLKGMLEGCKKGHYQLLKKPLTRLPVNLHICINHQMGYLSFENAAGQTMYLILRESGFISTFLDYMESLQKDYLCSVKETTKIVKELVQEFSLSN